MFESGSLGTLEVASEQKVTVAMSGIVVPDWQISQEADRGGRVRHPYANRATKQALLQRLLDFNPVQLFEAGELDVVLMRELVNWVGTQGLEDDDVGMEVDGEEENTDPCVSQRRIALEGIVATVHRNRHTEIYNLFSVALSLLALMCRVPTLFWTILTQLGLIFNKKWTRDLALELGAAVEEQTVENESEVVGFGVSDNKSYFRKTTFRHAETHDDMGPRHTNGGFVHTVNRLRSPVRLNQEIEMEFGEKLITFMNLRLIYHH